MRITIPLTAEEQDAIEFLIKLRNMEEHKDVESFIRGLVNTAVTGALSEHKEHKIRAIANDLLALDEAEVRAFISSRRTVA